MPKLYITTNGKFDYLVIPRVMATKLTKYYWVAVNQGVLPDEWGMPPRPLKMPEIPDDAPEEDVKAIVTQTFGEIVAERESGKADQGLIGLIPDEWEALIERHGIPEF